MQVPGAAEASVRNLPPSAIGDPSNLDAMGLLAENKGRPMEGIVEQVRDGSTLRVYLLPGFQFVQVFMAGIQASFIQCSCHYYKSFVHVNHIYIQFELGSTNGKESCNRNGC